MRMRERSSVERMRIALTEKRDILGDMMAAKREGLRLSFIKNGKRKKNRQVRAGESWPIDLRLFSPGELRLCGTAQYLTT